MTTPINKTLDVTILPTLIIKKDCLEKIEYICKEIHYTEWSGILFYKVNGDLTNLNTLSFDVLDILPLDIGTQAATSYQYGDEYIEYIASHPEYIMDNTIFEGHIHSHHSMGTTFSGTDMTELRESAELRNFFVSLIVNNAGKYSAKLGVKEEVTSNITEKISFRNFNVDIVTESNKVEDKVNVKSISLDITKESNVPDYFITNINTLREANNKAIEAKKETVVYLDNTSTYPAHIYKSNKYNIATPQQKAPFPKEYESTYTPATEILSPKQFVCKLISLSYYANYSIEEAFNKVEDLSNDIYEDAIADFYNVLESIYFNEINDINVYITLLNKALNLVVYSKKEKAAHVKKFLGEMLEMYNEEEEIKAEESVEYEVEPLIIS